MWQSNIKQDAPRPGSGGREEGCGIPKGKGVHRYRREQINKWFTHRTIAVDDVDDRIGGSRGDNNISISIASSSHVKVASPS